MRQNQYRTMNQKKRHKKRNTTYIKLVPILLGTIGLALLAVFGVKKIDKMIEGRSVDGFLVSINDREIGFVADEAEARTIYRQARRNVASGVNEMLFLEAELAVEPQRAPKNTLSSSEDVLGRMEEALSDAVSSGQSKDLNHAYTLKVNDYMVNLSGLDEVQALLQAAISKYDTSGKYKVNLDYDGRREFNVLAAEVSGESIEDTVEKDYSMGGAASFLEELRHREVESEEKGFEDYETGILSMDFDEKVEIVEAYLPATFISSLEDAVNNVLMEQQTVQIYKVQSGDTLSEIAIKVNIPMEQIVEMNDSLTSVNSILQIGQELIITVPEPELSVTRVEQNYYEESYDKEIEVIEIDSWYTNQIEVVQQPSAGFRKVIADVTYLNDKIVDKTILKEEVVMEAVAKVIKRGTKIPPTYVKPISGGRLTSKFGKRKAPKPGASTNHKGVDWAIPTGTPVYASCGGTVAKAGWGSGYGYVVYINHEDGKQTRYGHCSKVLVTVGQKVKQGDKIALSGNTGVSTGPHLHFEILVNGKQVDPFTYIK